MQHNPTISNGIYISGIFWGIKIGYLCSYCTFLILYLRSLHPAKPAAAIFGICFFRMKLPFCDDTHICIFCPLRAPKKHLHASTSRSICQTFHHRQTILSSPCGTWGVSPFKIAEKALGGSRGFHMLSPSISVKQGGITTIGAY